MSPLGSLTSTKYVPATGIGAVVKSTCEPGGVESDVESTVVPSGRRTRTNGVDCTTLDVITWTTFPTSPAAAANLYTSRSDFVVNVPARTIPGTGVVCAVAGVSFGSASSTVGAGVTTGAPNEYP